MAVRAGSFFFCGDERSEPGLDALSARRIIVGESWKTTPDEDSGSQGSVQPARCRMAFFPGEVAWGIPSGGRRAYETGWPGFPLQGAEGVRCLQGRRRLAHPHSVSS